MKIYNYNKTTKEFTIQTIATENPLEKGKYLIPANATIKEPLPLKDGFAICFNEEKQAWEHIEDNRGKTVYETSTKQKLKVDYLGAIKAEHTLLVPKEFDKWDDATKSWVADIEVIRTQKLNTINNSCNQSIISGFKSKALGSWHFYYSTLEEQSTLNSLITLGLNNNFKAQKILIVDEKEVKEQRIKYEHTIEQLREVLKDGATHIATQIEKKDLLEAQINAATTVEKLNEITW